MVESGFTSTADRQGVWAGKYTFNIQSKNGRHIQHLSIHPTEHEVLFAPNSKFKVINKSGTHVDMEEL